MLKRKVQTYIRQEGLLNETDKLLIACSGGSDSVALLSLMQALGYECVAAHMNFSLRGEESDRDEAFVRQLCTRWNIPLHLKRVDAKSYAQKQGLSIEMAARELRYAWFEQLRSELGLQAIVLGHHQNDDIETFFLNLLRGSGAKGLAGIPRKNGYLVRPLLCVTRQEILDYLAENQLDYVNDSSNFQSDYLRNKIRLQLLPLLEEIQPSAAASIHRSQALLRTADQDLTQLLAPALQRISEQGNCLHVAEASESLLYQWLSAYRFNAKEISRIWQQRFAPSGQLYQSESHELLLDRSCWLLRERASQNKSQEIFYLTLADICKPAPLQAETTAIDPTKKASPEDLPLCWNAKFFSRPFELEKSKQIAWLDADKLQFPLVLRHPQKGDAFVPFGMRGKKLISDFLTDLKYARFDKENVWLLLSAQDIVWVVGERISQDYCVSSSTQSALRIELL